MLFGSDIMPSTIMLKDFHLSTSRHPTILPLPIILILGNITQREEDPLVIMDHRIVKSENTTDLREIDSVISKFNKDLKNFKSTFAVVATWRVPDTVSYN